MAAYKVCLMGEGGVGKSTILSLLSKAPLISPRKPTIGVSIEKVNIGDVSIAMWDLGGQRRFQFMWEQFNQGSNLTLLVTDSSPQNVMLTKDHLERHLRSAESKIIAIANKQDIEGAMNPQEIEAALGVPTYGLVATNKLNETLLRNIIEKTIRN
jgi:small GTP-binding protein